MQPLLAADGAGSAMRREMSARQLIEAREIDLEHGYKELSIPAGPHGGFRMASDALHIWPRGNFMLIALPNADGSFTATLFLPKRGRVSFASLRDNGGVDEFLTRNFPDARELMPDCTRGIQRPSGGIFGNRRRASVACRGAGDADRRCGARHGSVSRPGHELLLRGLHRIRRLRRPACVLGSGVRGVRRRPQAQYRCHRRNGAGKLHGNARKRRGTRNFSCSRRCRWNSNGASRGASFRATPW